MKKFLGLLLVLGIVLLNPCQVLAASTAEATEVESAEKDNGDGTFTKVYTVSLKNTDEEATQEFKTVTMTFTFGKAVQSITCGDKGKFTASQENVDDNNDTVADKVVCTFTADEDDPASGSKFEVGTISAVIKKNSADADCSIDILYNGATGKINPNTGASVPYLIITGGIVLATGVYFATKKRTKLQKI